MNVKDLGMLWTATAHSCPEDRKREQLRAPHIEVFDDEATFTWNKEGHYLDVTVALDGVSWYYRDQNNPNSTSRQGDSFDEEIVSLLKAHATIL